MNTIILERLKLLLLAFVITTVAQAQTYSIEPSGYTTPVYENVTCTNSYGNTYTVHGQGVIVAKAIVSGRIATFIIKKVSGTFSKAGHVYVRADNPCGKQLGSKVKYSVGSSMVSVDYPLDFSSGSRTFVLRAVSSANEVFYTRPITIKVVDASSRKSDLYLQSAMGFSGATSLVRGNTYKFSARIVNKGTAAYTGRFQHANAPPAKLKNIFVKTLKRGTKI